MPDLYSDATEVTVHGADDPGTWAAASASRAQAEAEDDSASVALVVGLAFLAGTATGVLLTLVVVALIAVVT